ncbi:MAG: DUF2169 domain-containing protein [Uliginosibacterium sp.]|nr:DUF2169 domain-containing protein [Uliginosibacterium sp.]
MAFDKMGQGRRFHDVVVVRGAFDLCEGRVTQSSEQARPILADQWWNSDNAPHSSLKEAGDILLYKPGADVFVTGVARAPAGQMQQRWFAGVALMRQRDVLLRHARADRPSLLAAQLLPGLAPLPTRSKRCGSAALRARLWRSAPQIGQARRRKTRMGDLQGQPQRNRLLQRTNDGSRCTLSRAANRRFFAAPPQHQQELPLTGFGPVARFWQARSQYAGTYDAKWREQFQRSHTQGLAPDFPPDFDMRFYQCAPLNSFAARICVATNTSALAACWPTPGFLHLASALRINAHILAATQTTASSKAFVLDTVRRSRHPPPQSELALDPQPR